MEVFVVIVVCGILLTYAVIPWVNLARINAARKELQQMRGLQAQVARLEQALAETRTSAGKAVDGSPELEAEAEGAHALGIAAPAGDTVSPPAASAGLDSESEAEAGSDTNAAPDSVMSKSHSPEETLSSILKTVSQSSAKHAGATPQTAASPISLPPASAPASFQSPSAFAGQARFERQFGARLPVWIGGIALALGGFFLVKWTIDEGLLSPMVRVVLGVLLGCGLVGAGDWIRRRPQVSDGVRIAQALCGAGIATLYGAIYAGTTLYELFSPVAGFAGMAAVTGMAVLLSLWHGLPIALLGMVGGFLTPALVGSTSPNAPLLFMYLYAVLAGLLWVIRQRGWWWLGLPVIGGALLWVVMWMLRQPPTPEGSMVMSLFLIALCAAVAGITNRKRAPGTSPETSPDTHPESDSDATPDGQANAWTAPLKSLTFWLQAATLLGSVLMLAFVTGWSGYRLSQWGLYGLLSLGGVGLAYWRPHAYGQVPWLAMVLATVMLSDWDPGDAETFALVTAGFATLFIASGFVLQGKSERPLLWTGLVTATALGYFLLAYFHPELAAKRPSFLWGALAFGGCGLAVWAIWHCHKAIPADHPAKQHVFTLYAATATAFFSIALTIELEREFLSVAIAMQMLALCWINTMVRIRSLRWIIGAVAGVFGFLLLPQITLLIQLAAFGLVEVELNLQEGIPIVDFPLFQLGVPALCFVLGSTLLQRAQAETRQTLQEKLAGTFDMAAIALAGVMGYYLTRQAFHPEGNVLFIRAGFVERGVITNVLYLYGLACLWLGRRYVRAAVSWSGLGLCAVSLFRVLFFDCLRYNPLWAEQHVGEWPVLNAMLLPYVLPLAWTWLATRPSLTGGPGRVLASWRGLASGSMLLLGFVWLSLSVRQWFHGDVLHSGETSTAEFLAYSAAWLCYGLGLLLVGTRLSSRMLRIASLVVMLLTVGKVFLLDAGELDGLLRVASFMGLGVSLIGLSWFYTRYVFGAGKR